jgi:hypothetical protein
LFSGVVALVSYLSFLVSWFPLRSEHLASANKLGVFSAFCLWLLLVVFVFEVLTKRPLISKERDIKERKAAD